MQEAAGYHGAPLAHVLLLCPLLVTPRTPDTPVSLGSSECLAYNYTFTGMVPGEGQGALTGKSYLGEQTLRFITESLGPGF